MLKLCILYRIIVSFILISMGYGINPTRNGVPVADDISLATDEDTPVAITMTGSDADGDGLTFTVTSGPSNGTYDGTTYMPNLNFNGGDSFTYVANDGTDNSDEATVSITVNAVNDVPLLSARADATT